MVRLPEFIVGFYNENLKDERFEETNNGKANKSKV